MQIVFQIVLSQYFFTIINSQNLDEKAAPNKYYNYIHEKHCGKQVVGLRLQNRRQIYLILFIKVDLIRDC